MKNKYFKTIGLFPLLTVTMASVVASGCMGDEDENQYRADQEAQNVAQLQAVSKVYTGTMTSQSDGSSLGNITITLEADSQSQKSSDNLGTETSADLAGNVTYNGMISNVVVPFTGGAFTQDPNGGTGGTVNISNIPITPAPVVPAGSTPPQLTITGTISGNTFTGQIYIEGWDGFSGDFSVTNGAPQNSLNANAMKQVSSSARVQSLNSEVQTNFTGSFTIDGSSHSYEIALTNPDEDQAAFMDLFSETHYVDLNVTDNSAAYPTVLAKIDETAGKYGSGQLTATLAHSGPSGIDDVILTCDAQKSAGAILSWTCSFSGSNVTSPLFVLTPGQAKLAAAPSVKAKN